MPAILALFYAGLRIFLLANLVGFVVRVLMAFGLYFLVMEPTTDLVMDVLSNRFGLLPPDVADWIGFLRIDDYVSIVMSAYAIVAVSNIVLKKS